MFLVILFGASRIIVISFETELEVGSLRSFVNASTNPRAASQSSLSLPIVISADVDKIQADVKGYQYFLGNSCFDYQGRLCIMLANL